MTQEKSSDIIPSLTVKKIKTAVSPTFIGFTAVWMRFLKYSNVFITDKKLKNTVKLRDSNTYRRIDKCLYREYYFIHERSIIIDITII